MVQYFLTSGHQNKHMHFKAALGMSQKYSSARKRGLESGKPPFPPYLYQKRTFTEKSGYMLLRKCITNKKHYRGGAIQRDVEFGCLQ